jgi:hypothetical protein
MLRDRVFDDYLLAADWNAMAFYLVQGVLVAVALALCSSQPLVRLALLLLAAVLAAASLLPMSRGAVVILIISGAAVVLAYGILKPKVILTVAALIVGVFLWVPDAVYQRFAIPVTIYRNETRQLEARTRVYLTTLENLSDSGFTGVSVSQYYGKWGRENLWVKNERVVGTHNVYAQIAMYWGLPGLLALLALVWQAYRCLPARPGTDAIRLCLLGIALSVFLESMFVHTLHGKEFSLALGLLAGSSLWIWPSRSLHAARAPASAPRNDAR